MNTESLLRAETGLGTDPSLFNGQAEIAGGLQGLEQHLGSSVGGLILVETTSKDAALAVTKHLLRRAQTLRQKCLTAQPDRLDGCFRDIAARLGIRTLSYTPSVAAKELSGASSGAVISILGTPTPGSWDREVLGYLSEQEAPGLFATVVYEQQSGHGLPSRAPVFVVSGDDETAVRAWWQGVIEEITRAAFVGSIADLERWWSTMARSGLRGDSDVSSLTPVAKRLLRRLQVVQRSWPEAALDRLASTEGLAELVDTGAVRRESGFVVMGVGVGALDAESDDRQQAAGALLQIAADDPWALARSAALYLEAGRATQAEQLLIRAVKLAGHPQMRRDLWRIGIDALSHSDADSHRSVTLRLGNTAIAMNDCDVAGSLAAEAQRGSAESQFEPMFLLGRAHYAQADLRAARVCFQRAEALVDRPESLAALRVHQADVLYWEGEFDSARDLAQNALQSSQDMAVRLHARNVIGKTMLARALWEEAEAHFAADENDAACEGLVEVRLRARTNRAIALLRLGRTQQAQRMFESVLEEGAVVHSPRAEALALSNLAWVAHMQRDWLNALDLYERAIDACRWLGDKISLANPTANLAELRLELGLTDEAEQALLFARRIFSSGVPPSNSSQFLLLSAATKFARGETVEARQLVDQSLVDAVRSSNAAWTVECHKLAVRIALEDGDTREAENALFLAKEHATTVSDTAEVSFLELLVWRALGRDVTELVLPVRELAADAGDQELTRELATALAEIALAEGDIERARLHLTEAIRIRDRVASRLPESMRGRYLARRDLQALGKLQERISQAPTIRPPTTTLRPSSGDQDPLRAFIGTHPSVTRLHGTVRKVATAHTPVLLHGESGTGKELVAEAIHRLSPRRNGPLVKVNCAALAEGVLLSELFGHEKGAFTGAHGRRRGRFELAHGGTLFLDEIGDVSPAMQAALLRVLQEKTFERVGGTTSVHSDVRVLCATHRDLRALVDAGKFREDLYYRLSAIVIEIPPLRERRSDIALLADHVLQGMAQATGTAPLRITRNGMRMLEEHSWPGNVRELENVLRAAAVLADGPELDEESLAGRVPVATPMSQPPPSCAPPESRGVDPSSVWPSDDALDLDPSTVAWLHVRAQKTTLSDLKRRIERDCIQQALDETAGNITRAAALLGMKRPRLSQLVKEHGLSIKGALP